MIRRRGSAMLAGMRELTPDLVHLAFDKARDEALEAAAKMVEARAIFYRAHARDDSGGVLEARAAEAEDIAAALRALKGSS